MTPNERVLVVEGDSPARASLGVTLERAGFIVRMAPDVDAGWRILIDGRPDAMILDLLLPGRHGIEMLRQVREAPETRRLPVMVLSDRDTEMDKLLCFEHGADDYLTKPFNPRELVARLRVMLRRMRPAENGDAIAAGPLHVFPLSREARIHGRPLALTPREFALLLFLARNPGRALSRPELLRNVWGDGYAGDARTVDVHVRRLRQKLGEDPSRIETVTGVGYRLAREDGGAA